MLPESTDLLQPSQIAHVQKPRAARISLPPPRRKDIASLEETLSRRRSVREFAEDPLTEEQIGQLLWASQGIANPEGFRTAPSAGALYSLEIYLATTKGYYQYIPHTHQIELHSGKDIRRALYLAAFDQESVLSAPAVFVIAAVYSRLAEKYGEERSVRYACLEAGHAAQNVLLQATALGLAGVPIGAFRDDQVQRALSLPLEESPLYLIPVGAVG
ncbi:MAG TPA: SagB/ThcOx family dehydrogenase [Acidobacteriota bacterium]|nr:SagB/ThcOx family dehydrogenase [Acidobacteriota bacterium]